MFFSIEHDNGETYGPYDTPQAAIEDAMRLWLVRGTRWLDGLAILGHDDNGAPQLLARGQEIPAAAAVHYLGEPQAAAPASVSGKRARKERIRAKRQTAALEPLADMARYVDLRTAARMLDTTPEAVREHLRAGRLAGKRMGGALDMVREDSIAAMREDAA